MGARGLLRRHSPRSAENGVFAVPHVHPDELFDGDRVAELEPGQHKISDDLCVQVSERDAELVAGGHPECDAERDDERDSLAYSDGIVELV